MADEHTSCDPSLSGLSSAEVESRIAEGKVNVNTDLKTKSVREVVLENVCTLFNLINLILALLVIATGAWKNLTFLGIVVANTGIGIVQALRSKRMVDKLTLLAAKKAVAVRDGAEVELDLDQIVLDDLIRLGRGDQIPADARVVSGECHVNESLLTGESNPIHKRPGDELMSGSFIDAGLVYARVRHVGADNYVARINNEAKYVKKVNSEIMNALGAIVRFASVLMVPLGLALFCASIYRPYVAWSHVNPEPAMGFAAWLLTGTADWTDVSAAILSTVGALLGMIPQGLVLLTSSVLAIATIRLARRKVLAQQLYCIETLARVDVLCLDKTGTITSGHMQVDEVYVANEGRAVRAQDFAEERSRQVHEALLGIARATSADANETCTAILNYYETADARAPEATRVIPFNSAKKWSGASFGSVHAVMGAAQFVLGAQTYAAYEAAISELASSCRVLAVAAVDGFDDEGNTLGEARLLGFVTIKDEIRASAAETIRYFSEQGVRLNVISGDDPRTVASIARVAGVPGADSFVDAMTLDTPAKLDAAVDRYRVFGRVTPQQKRELVVAMQRRGHTVAMTGDGVNDVLALKEADCSVAMAAGSDAARNVAEIVLVNNDFASMPEVVAEGRRSINNLQRSAALFLTKTLFSMGLAALCIVAPPYPFQPVTMTLINFFCIGFPSFVLALEPNRSRVRGSFLANVLKKALPAATGVLATSVLCIGSARLFGLSSASVSTMCLISTCAVGLHLIWRISVPFTPLRKAVFACAVLGIAAGVTVFPGFFSIAPLSVGTALLTAIFSCAGCLLFAALADALDRSPERTSRLATGFGRGIRVHGRGSKRRVSSTGTVFQRALSKARTRLKKRAAARDLARAEAHAQEQIDVREARPAQPAMNRDGVKTAGTRHGGRKKRYCVEQANGGIRVRMPKTTRKKDQ
ncbi:MAG: HAD-IC family P-type ATPase [Coriobacteriaceae bacterium]|nr:HAD-IC family P-type ATPase [Coriobacteriaceae bacterium]